MFGFCTVRVSLEHKENHLLLVSWGLYCLSDPSPSTKRKDSRNPFGSRLTGVDVALDTNKLSNLPVVHSHMYSRLDPCLMIRPSQKTRKHNDNCPALNPKIRMFEGWHNQASRAHHHRRPQEENQSRNRMRRMRTSCKLPINLCIAFSNHGD